MSTACRCLKAGLVFGETSLPGENEDWHFPPDDRLFSFAAVMILTRNCWASSSHRTLWCRLARAAGRSFRSGDPMLLKTCFLTKLQSWPCCSGCEPEWSDQGRSEHCEKHVYYCWPDIRQKFSHLMFSRKRRSTNPSGCATGPKLRVKTTLRV